MSTDRDRFEASDRMKDHRWFKAVVKRSRERGKAERILRIRRELAAGTYIVDARKVADAVIWNSLLDTVL